MSYGELPEIPTADGRTVRGCPIHILNSPDGAKTALLRLPTSAELLKYLSTQRSIYRDLGRGMGESRDVPTPKADLALFTTLRLDSGPNSLPFDEAEALYGLTILLKHRVSSCERDGQSYVISITTLWGDTTHTVRIPYQSELSEYRQHAFAPRSMPNNMQEDRYPPEVPVKLYDKILQSVTGYAGVESVNGAGAESVVPPHHKRSVIYSLNSALTLLDPGLDPNF